MTEHAASDVSRAFVEAVEQAGSWQPVTAPWSAARVTRVRAEAKETIATMATECGVRDVNRIKPGIAEATRAILRRVPAAPQQLLRTPARPLLSDVHPDVRREAVGVLGWLQATGTLAEVARLFPNASRASQAGHEGLRR